MSRSFATKSAVALFFITLGAFGSTEHCGSNGKATCPESADISEFLQNKVQVKGLKHGTADSFKHEVHVVMNSNDSYADDEEADVTGPKACCQKGKWDAKCACKQLGCCKKGKTEQCFQDACRARDPKKCFAMYLMADNNLDGALAADLQELISNTNALSHPGFYPLVYIDRHATESQTPVEGLKAADGVTDVSFYSGLRYIEKNFLTNKLQVVEELPEANSDDKETVEKFLTWAFTRCKAWDPDAKVMLTLSSHGAGWMGFGGDADKPSLLSQDKSQVSLQRHQRFQKAILNGQVKEAIEEAMSKANPKITTLDFLGFDACFMMTYNTMHLYGAITKWFMASQATEPGHGWFYDTLDPSGGVKDLAVGMIDNFAHTGTASPKTLAAFKSKDLYKLATSLDQLALTLQDASQETFHHVAGAQLDSARVYDPVGGQVDFGHFLKLASLACGTSCSDGVGNAIKVAKGKYHAMLANGHTAFGPDIDPEITGMSLFFPLKPFNNGYHEHFFDVWFEGTYGFTAASDRTWMQFVKFWWDNYQCKDRDDGAKNNIGQGCESYGYPCGSVYNDGDFVAAKMCCACMK